MRAPLPLLCGSKHELLLVLCCPANHHTKREILCGWRRVNDFMSAWASRWNCQFGAFQTIVRCTMSRHNRGNIRTKPKRKVDRVRCYCLVTIIIIITIKLSWHFLSISSICSSVSFTQRRTNRVSNWFVCDCVYTYSAVVGTFYMIKYRFVQRRRLYLFFWLGIIQQWLAVFLLLFAV